MVPRTLPTALLSGVGAGEGPGAGLGVVPILPQPSMHADAE